MNQSDATELAQPFSTSQSLIDIDPDATLGVNVLTQSGRLIIHLINYDFDYEADTFQAKLNLQIKVDAKDITQASYFNVEDGTETSLVTSESNGLTTFTVPKLDVWGIVVLETE
jgi:hypothetical protein